MPTVYYRTEDPAENLKLRLVVREVARTRNYNEDGSTINPFFHEIELSWQEKLYSPAEIADYLQNKNTRSINATQLDTRRYLQRLEHSGKNIHEMLDKMMVYTYVDKDHFVHEKPPPLLDCGTQEPYLSAAVRSLGGDFNSELTDRERSIAQRVFRAKPFKSMHVCLATDVDVDALQGKHGPVWDAADHFTENVLCTIHMFQDGLMEVSPAFSGIVDEDAGPQTDGSGCVGGMAISAFLQDTTAEAAIKRGFRLATFRVRSDTGTEYEYAIQNKNELLAPFKIEKFEQQREKVNALKAAENRSAQNSSNWKQDPTSRDKTVAVYAEIVSARGFSGGRLHVAYEVLLPPNWLLRTGDLSDGVGKRSSTMTQPAAVVAVPLVEYPAAGASSSTAADGTMKRTASLEELVSRAANSYEDTAGEGMLQGCTQSAILNDSDGIRTAFTLPFVRPRWAGLYLSHAAMKITRLIVGSAFFIASVMAVVLGIGYPFWIVPALGILFVLGTGMPGGPPQAVLRKSHRDSTSSTISRQKENRIAKRVTYSKIVPQQCEVVGETITEPCAVFNHLLSFSFDVKDATAEEYSLLAPSAHQPTIFFQVYSTDYFGRQRLEGYGYHYFSDAAGSVDAEVSTWKPMGTIRDQMNEFFLGNSLRLRDESYVETVNKAAKALNRFGMKTQSAGCVRIRTQSILTDPRLVEQQRLQQAEVLQQQQMSTAKVKRTVDDILKSFRLSASAANTPRVGGIATSAGGRIAGLMTPRKTAEFSPAAGKPSPNQILSTLNETAKANKVADILARARAKTGQQKGAKDSTAIPPTASASKSATAGSSSSNIGELPPMKKLALGQLKRPNSDAAQPPLSSRRDVSSGSSSFDRDNPYDPHIDRPAHDRKQPIVTPRSGRASATGTPRVLEPLPEGRTFSSTRAHSPGESPSGSSESPSFSTPSYSPHAPLHNAQQPQNGRAARRYDVGADSPSGDDSDAQQLEEEQRGAPQSARGGAGADSGTDTGEEDAPLLRRDS